MHAFNFPGQEHLPKDTLTDVARGTHTTALAPKPAKTATEIAAERQRRVIAVQLAQKSLADTATIAAVISAAKDIDRFITTGAATEDVVAHGATAVRKDQP